MGVQDRRLNGTAKRVLVTGGGGYIGSALLPKLLDSGYRVRLLDILVFGIEPIANVANHPNLEIIKGDFLQADHVAEAMQDVDTVVHLGAIVGDPACAHDSGLAAGVNLLATRMIAQIGREHHVQRMVFASTCSVYGASDDILDEGSALNPVSLYARSKIASEQVLTQMAADTFSPVMMRFGTIYGLSGRTRFDLVVNLLTAKALVEGQITIFGGDQWRPFVHVDDAAQAILKAVEAPRECVHNEVFNVGSNAQNYTISQVGEIVHECVPTAQLIHSGSDADRRNYRVRFDKIANVLEFVPQWTVEQGVQQVIERIESGEIENYRDARYSNLRSTRLLKLIHDFPIYKTLDGQRPGVGLHGEMWDTQAAKRWKTVLDRTAAAVQPAN